HRAHIQPYAPAPAPDRSAPGGGAAEQLVPGAELDARLSVRLAERALVLVDRLPARVLDEGQPALDEQVLEIALALRQHAGGGVLQQVLGRRVRVLLVGADDAARAALDPAGAVEPRHRRTVDAEDAPLDVGDDAAIVVERHPGKGDPAIADAAKDER